MNESPSSDHLITLEFSSALSILRITSSQMCINGGRITKFTHWYSFWRKAGTTFLASLLSFGGEPLVGLESATWLSLAIPV